jgi:acylphosphatase
VEPTLVRRRVRVHGRVQGVAFRAHTRERARREGAAGWVRNRPDGSVEAVFEGVAPTVEALVDACRTGPSWARVDRIDVSEEPPEGLSGFEIR